jgi:hypothetical protein
MRGEECMSSSLGTAPSVIIEFAWPHRRRGELREMTPLQVISGAL